ncbi:hypothetical protein TVNIR_2296 [Thioalkalivibrio nitratireducens DSM 14787]|uniref:Uncharacterized protein n=1 Tax=Thioalkalivibrio nitratireducens (strain DSM 14787 / UNIQEM 213 / ALEN2) TaxID=1255043 RepID=L0DYB8_THIND|nr:hypothetical protein TVNIR_2296 [Thioalkalivibrio nitratireducens DSM 14787]
MGCAARVLELDPLEEVRRMAHEQLDQWLEQMRPLFEQEKPPTLLELSQHFTRTRQQLLGGVLQSLADAHYGHCARAIDGWKPRWRGWPRIRSTR